MLHAVGEGYSWATRPVGYGEDLRDVWLEAVSSGSQAVVLQLNPANGVITYGLVRGAVALWVTAPFVGDDPDVVASLAASWAVLRQALSRAPADGSVRWEMVSDAVSSRFTLVEGGRAVNHPDGRSLAQDLLARMDRAGVHVFVGEPAEPAESSTALSHPHAFDDGCWSRYLAWAWRAAACPPSAGAPTAAPGGPTDEARGQPYEGAATFAALLHLVMYGLGWSRPDLGLQRWVQAGKPLDDDVLTVVDEWWGDGVDDLLAWMAVSQPWCRQGWWQYAQGTAMRGFDDRTDLPDRYAERRRAAAWRAVFGGGYDPMHLMGHVDSPALGGDSVDGRRGLVSGVWFHQGRPRATLTVDAYGGWYRALVDSGIPGRLEGRDVRVDVTCRGFGWMGEFRRSARTGLWFRGRHRVHVLGN